MCALTPENVAVVHVRIGWPDGAQTLYLESAEYEFPLYARTSLAFHVRPDATVIIRNSRPGHARLYFVGTFAKTF